MIERNDIYIVISFDALIGDIKERHKRRSRNWGRTERALNNIDVTWTKLINAYKYEQRAGYRRVYDPNVCKDKDRGGRFPPPMLNYMIAEDIDILFFDKL